MTTHEEVGNQQQKENWKSWNLNNTLLNAKSSKRGPQGR
jgi:hypothetical protein